MAPPGGQKGAASAVGADPERDRKRAAIQIYLSGDLAFATAAVPPARSLGQAAADPEDDFWRPGPHWEAFKRAARPWYWRRVKLLVACGPEDGSRLLYYYAGPGLDRRKYALGSKALKALYARFAALAGLECVFLGDEERLPGYPSLPDLERDWPLDRLLRFGPWQCRHDLGL